MSASMWRGALLLGVSVVALAAHPRAQTSVQRPDGSPATVTVVTGADGVTMTIAQPQGGAAPVGGPRPQAAEPPRDRSAAPATGTSRIAGRVTAADSGRPLRRATVRLNTMGRPESRSTITDQDGRYEFTELPAGQYTVFASKSGYVQLGYRQQRPNTTVRPLQLGDRENADRADVALPPGGVITGRVVDEYGEAVSDVMVSAQRLQYMGGTRRPVMAGPPAATNDIGEFRVYGLPPGEYYLSAIVRSSMNPFDASSSHAGFAPTYYPAAPNIAAAQRITLHSGDLVPNIVISLAEARVARVSGTVLDASGLPARSGTVMVTPREGGGGMGLGNGFVRPDGSFTINGVPPGDYILRTLPGPPGPAPSALPVPSVAYVTVNGTDLDNVVVAPLPRVSIIGRLTGDPAALAKIAPGSIRLTVVPAGQSVATGFIGPLPQARPVADDLTFELFAYPGQVTIRPVSLPGLVIRGVRVNGVDAMRGFEVTGAAAPPEVEVEVSDQTGRITVSAANARGDAVPDRDIVIFPVDDDGWSMQIQGHGATGRTSEEGSFQSTPLIAGTYYVADTDPLDPGQAYDPDVLDTLRGHAQRITVGAGETVNVPILVNR
jgi:hypothetical protein